MRFLFVLTFVLLIVRGDAQLQCYECEDCNDVNENTDTTSCPKGDPTPTDPTPTDPTSSGPTPTGPTTTDPTSSDPTSSGPTPTDPTSSDPTSSGPTPTDPTSSDPTSPGPTPTDPTPSDPTPTDLTSAEGSTTTLSTTTLSTTTLSTTTLSPPPPSQQTITEARAASFRGRRSLSIRADDLISKCYSFKYDGGSKTKRGCETAKADADMCAGLTVDYPGSEHCTTCNENKCNSSSAIKLSLISLFLAILINYMK